MSNERSGERPGRGGRRTLPYVFTEQGVAMLSTVLNSERAIAVNIAITRTFVRIRQILTSNKELAARLLAMEQKYDRKFKVVFDILRQLYGAPPGSAQGTYWIYCEKEIREIYVSERGEDADAPNKNGTSFWKQ